MTGPKTGGLQEEKRVQRNLREEEDAHLHRTPPQKIAEGLVVGKRLTLIKLIKSWIGDFEVRKNSLVVYRV